MSESASGKSEKAYDREHCLELLRKKQDSIIRSGGSGFPKKSDFDDAEVSAIKAYFGPWPRALEAAGIKEPPPVTSKDKNIERRIRAKRKRNLERKNGNR